ncbi:MAG: class I SAM-dependent methyltransferase [Desulfobacterales bacterium]|nr:class I SAM-dependent methyltransferase [Desulfobacterales bacterium]
MTHDPYRRLAKVYDACTEPFNAGLRHMGLKLAMPRPDQRVLEVGCGTGTNLLHYQQAGSEVFGIDLSPRMLAQAHRKLGSRARLHQGDAARLPYPDAVFDLAVAMLTLHEMPRSKRSVVMEEMARVVKAEGQLLLVDFHPGPLQFPRGYGIKPFILMIERLAGREHFRNYCDFITRGGLPPLLDAAGLQIDRQRIVSGGNLVLLRVRTSP